MCFSVIASACVGLVAKICKKVSTAKQNIDRCVKRVSKTHVDNEETPSSLLPYCIIGICGDKVFFCQESRLGRRFLLMLFLLFLVFVFLFLSIKEVHTVEKKKVVRRQEQYGTPLPSPQKTKGAKICNHSSGFSRKRGGEVLGNIDSERLMRCSLLVVPRPRNFTMFLQGANLVFSAVTVQVVCIYYLKK